MTDADTNNKDSLAARWRRTARPRRAAAWLAALAAGVVALGFAWTDFDDPRRGDGSWGHASIDFAGQWLLGRMLLEGHARQLYHRGWQRHVLQEAFPRQDGLPEGPSDVENLMGWMIGGESWEQSGAVASCATPLAAGSALEGLCLLAIAGRVCPEELKLLDGPRLGGPLYPPVHALMMAPLASLPPRLAYRLTQAAILLLTLALGGLVQSWSRGWIWCPVAAVLLMTFPGYAGTLNLGQNALFSLALLLAGWRLLGLGRPGLAGCAWGLLAFKPVWAVSFFLVPLLTRRWRMAAGMALVGGGLILATLPFTGVSPWLGWLAVGRQASAHYERDESWIVLSRDLQNLPLRYLLDFPEPGVTQSPYGRLPHRLGLALWLGVAGVWAGGVALRWRQARALVGRPATFVLLGGWLVCYHFMYYDSLLAALPVFVLFAGYLPLSPEGGGGQNAGAGSQGGERIWPYPLVPTLFLVALLLLHQVCHYVVIRWRFQPVETVTLLLLWLWCAWGWPGAGRGEAGYRPSRASS